MNPVAKLAPSDEGDSPQCGEMSRSDRGDRRCQRLSAEQTEGEKKLKVLSILKFISPSTANAVPLSTAVSVGAVGLRPTVATGNPHPRQREAKDSLSTLSDGAE